VANLEVFFKPITAIRGTGKDEEFVRTTVQTAATTSTLLTAGTRFDKDGLNTVNEKILKLGATLEAWEASLPEDVKTAYYKST
jgi:hypothetical protein